MFVRWKTRKNTLYAYLCQSERKDGKPVSSTLGYLGSCSANATAEQQQAFWAQAETNLQPHNLSGADRTKIENAIAQKLPRITITKKLSKTTFFQDLIEGFTDGILILTQQGKWINANDNAREICNLLAPNSSQLKIIPEEIWQVCQTLVDSQSLYPHQPVIIESEVKTQQLAALRIRARWLRLDSFSDSCFLVILEDRYQSMRRTLLSESKQYGLTPRESEVWLLRQLGYTFQAISEKLFISLNTVKKHMKNIRAKRESTLLMENYREPESEQNDTYSRDRQSENSLLERILSL